MRGAHVTTQVTSEIVQPSYPLALVGDVVHCRRHHDFHHVILPMTSSYPLKLDLHHHDTYQFELTAHHGRQRNHPTTQSV